MKRVASLLLAAAAAAHGASTAPAARPDGQAPQAYAQASTPFDAFGTGYKDPKVLTDAFFDPFKVQADLDLSRREGASVTTDSVAGAIDKRGVSGIFYPGAGETKSAIIGDQVFSVGDELSFPSDDKPGLAPLIPGATVVLQDIGSGSLSFEVRVEGEAPRLVHFSLRDFWQP